MRQKNQLHFKECMIQGLCESSMRCLVIGCLTLALIWQNLKKKEKKKEKQEPANRLLGKIFSKSQPERGLAEG
ncbi:hypothetical protein GQ457_08G017650 [Hibiscus cannabinus]